MSSKEYYQANKAKWSDYYKARRQKAPLYATWQQMLTRTGHKGNPKDHDVSRYIERGIDICDAWTSYREFEVWALCNGWKRGLQIDRVDNNKGYDPSNCRFVTPKENARNKSNTHKLEDGTPLITLWERMTAEGKCNLPYKLVEGRVSRGWNPVEAITSPKKIIKKK